MQVKTKELVVILDRPMSQEEYLPIKRAVEQLQGVEAVGRDMTDDEKRHFFAMKAANLAVQLTAEQVKAVRAPTDYRSPSQKNG